jgi:hypothetical protein
MRHSHQEENYCANPGMKDYEQMLGHFPLNVGRMHDWEQITDPSVSPEERERRARALPKPGQVPTDHERDLLREKTKARGPDREGGAENLLRSTNPDCPREAAAASPQEPGAQGQEPAAAPENLVRPRATKKQMLERITFCRNALINGAPHDEVVLVAMQNFGLKRRMAQIYVRWAKRRLAAEAGREDYLGHLQLSKLQCERLLAQVQERTFQCQDLKIYASLLRQVIALMKYRDLTMASIHAHRTATKRDKSADAAAAMHKRERMFVMPRDEFFERLENMRNLWWRQWYEELAEPLVKELFGEDKAARFRAEQEQKKQQQAPPGTEPPPPAAASQPPAVASG